jgi:hypothetical protein
MIKTVVITRLVRVIHFFILDYTHKACNDVK